MTADEVSQPGVASPMAWIAARRVAEGSKPAVNARHG